MILVIGIDAATWSVIAPRIAMFNTLKNISLVGRIKKVTLQEKPISASVWCSMFSGKTPEQHGHHSYVVDGKVLKREDVKTEFVWDILHRQGFKIHALNVPFVVPPYSFNVDFRPVGFGLPLNEKEWEDELHKVTTTTKAIIQTKPDVVIAVYTLLDRIQHLHWGEPIVLEWYKKIDDKLHELIFDTGFLKDKDNRLIIISDHGFCFHNEAKVQTLPAMTKDGPILGDHHEDFLLITHNIDYEITKPQDVWSAILYYTLVVKDGEKIEDCIERHRR